MTFLGDKVKRTFLHHDVGRNKCHSFEIDFDDEEQAWYTDSSKDSRGIIKEVLSFLKSAALLEKNPGDPEKYKIPEASD